MARDKFPSEDPRAPYKIIQGKEDRGTYETRAEARSLPTGLPKHPTGHIAAGPIETSNETGRDRIDSGCESDWYRGRCRLGSHRGKLANRNHRRNLTANQMAAIAGSRSYWSAAQRYSMATPPLR